MPIFLTSLLTKGLGFLGLAGFSPVKLILISLSVVTALSVGFGYIQTKRLNARVAEIHLAKAQVVELQATLAETKKQHERAMKAIAEVQAANDKRDVSSDKIKEEIHNVPASDDGPVAPVLGRALDRVRERAKANSR
jgi:hypothetical protein